MSQQAQTSEKITSGRRNPELEHEEFQPITPDERNRMIAEAAYLIAEQRGFRGDAALDDWLQAEVEVDARLLESD